MFSSENKFYDRKESSLTKYQKYCKKKIKSIISGIQLYNKKNNQNKNILQKNTNRCKTGKTDILPLFSKRHFQSVY